MAEKMLRFVSLDQELPEKRPAETRAQDFHEIYADYIAEKAAAQASRDDVAALGAALAPGVGIAAALGRDPARVPVERMREHLG